MKNKIIRKLKNLKEYVKDTRGYYSDGVDEEIQMFLDELLLLANKLD